MVSSRQNSEPAKRKRTPATTPEARENQMISLAVDHAELQLREGTAPAAVVVHYLRLADEKTKLEREKLRKEILLTEKKIQQTDTADDLKQMFEEATTMFKVYQGHSTEEEYYDD